MNGFYHNTTTVFLRIDLAAETALRNGKITK